MGARQWADTLALVCFLTEIPDIIAVPCIAIYILSFKRPTATQLGYTSLLFIVTFSFASHTLWYLWRRLAFGALADSLLGPSSHAGIPVLAVAALQMLVGVGGGTPIVSDYAEALFEPGIFVGKFVTGISLFFYSLLTLQAIPTLFQVGSSGSSTAGSKARKPLSSLRKIPLWFTIIKIWLFLRPDASETQISLYPQLRFVEKNLVGFLVPNPSRLKFYVNGVRWLHVYCKDGEKLAVLYGLRPRILYQVEITGYASLRVSTLNDTRDHVPQKPMPQLTLSDALETSESQLAELRQRLRRTRRENGKKINAIKLEISNMSDRIERSRRGDEKVRKRIYASSDAARQTQHEFAEQAATVEKIESRCDAIEVEIPDLETQNRDAAQKKETALADYSKELERIEALQTERRQQLNKAKEKVALQQQQLSAIRREISESKKSIETAVETFLTQRDITRKAKEERNLRQRQEFESSIEKLEADAQKFQAMMQWPSATYEV